MVINWSQALFVHRNHSPFKSGQAKCPLSRMKDYNNGTNKYEQYRH